MDKHKLYDLVYSWSTESEHGFNYMEEEAIISKIGKEKMNMDKYNNAMRGNNCMFGKYGTIMYHCDIFMALTCGLENRDMTWLEWD